MFLKGVARGFQLILSVVVLGLSISLAKDNHYGSVPSQTGYAAFAGAFGTLVALIGVGSFFVEALAGVISFVLDGVAALALLVAGIVYAVTLKGISCSSFTYNTARYDESQWHNAILNGGCDSSEHLCWWEVAVAAKVKDASDVRANCRTAQADTVFMFLAFAACAGALVATFLSRR